MVRCALCGEEMQYSAGVVTNEVLPREIQMVLAEFALPEHLVNYFVCPKKHTAAWLVPVACTDDGVFQFVQVTKITQ